jgi:hypothetical protein
MISKTETVSANLASHHDETIISLRRVCDRYAGHLVPGHALPHELIREIFASLPDGIFGSITLPAVGADQQGVTFRVDPLFYTYMAATAEYCHDLAHDNASSLKEATVDAKDAAD